MAERIMATAKDLEVDGCLGKVCFGTTWVYLLDRSQTLNVSFKKVLGAWMICGSQLAWHPGWLGGAVFRGSNPLAGGFLWRAPSALGPSRDCKEFVGTPTCALCGKRCSLFRISTLIFNF